MTLRRLSTLTLILLGVAVAPALADTVDYSFTAFGTTATFSLPSNPTPDLIGANYFQLDDVAVNVPGYGTYSGNIDFFTTAGGGGAGSGVDVLSGPQLFSGSLSDPTLLTGSFALSGTVTPDSDGPVAVSGTLNAIAASTSPVPEPASIILLLTGLASTGSAAMLRRRRASAADVD